MAYGHSIEHRNGGTVHLEPAIDEWYGQTFSALGDSIVWAGAPMLNRMRSRLGFLSYRNLGVSGRPMADGTANGVGTVTTALANNFATDSLVYIASGTNDFKLNVPLGGIGELGATSHSRSTFYGAYRTTIDHLLSQNPDVQIVLATPLQRNNGGYSTTTTNTAGHMLRDYRSAVFSLGDMYSLPVVDLYALSGISEKTLDRYTSDGLHPNEQGYVQMARVVVGQIRSGGTSASAALLYDSGTRNITALATGVMSGNIRLRVRNGWARLDFADVRFDTNGPTLFASYGPLAPWAPMNPESGKGFVTEVNTNRTTRVTINYNGGVDLYGAPANSVLNGFAMWPFDRTPPATPLGDPA